MKQILLLLLAVNCSLAQNVAIRFASDLGPDSYYTQRGAPTNFPVSFYGLTGTNTDPGYTVMTSAAWLAVQQQYQSNWNYWSTNTLPLTDSNITYQSRITFTTNLASLALSYSNLNFIAQNFSSITNLATAKFAIQAEGEVLMRLKPILQQFYQAQ